MKRSKSEKIFNMINILCMIFLCAITVFPYLNQLAISLNEGMDARMGGIVLLPRKFTFENYKTVILNKDFLNSLELSVSIVLLKTILSLLVVFAAAYGLTRKNLPYKKGLTLMLMIPSYISAGVIPTYILFKYLHLINNYWVYIIPGMFAFYNMIVLRSFLQELPVSIDESARIDGANELQIMLLIILPLSLPVLATVALWVSVATWNDWTTTLMFVTKKQLFPLQYLMMRLIKESSLAQEIARESSMNYGKVVSKPTPETVKAATLIVTTLPIIMTYPFFQKFFIKGVILGAVKE